MDVDEKKAEQTWFDNCIDDMLMDEEQSLSDEEEDDYAVEEVPPSNPTVVTTNLTVFDTISSDSTTKVLHKPALSPESQLVQKQFVQQQLPAIFANESLMVVQKPAGLACQGGTGVKYSVDTLLGSVNEFADYKLVHRLDRGTSGALPFTLHR
ncbi:hypothetical protein LPJ55_003122 [Coemansia sp. RSA 990]|nr:hypothetical protein LPJ55_003122 [Coemansia sp. RSA 990]